MKNADQGAPRVSGNAINGHNKLLHLTQRSSLLFVHSLRSFLHKNPLQPLRK
jgi:hypothetical protein